jgi:hypothetical protein
MRSNVRLESEKWVGRPHAEFQQSMDLLEVKKFGQIFSTGFSEVERGVLAETGGI